MKVERVTEMINGRERRRARVTCDCGEVFTIYSDPEACPRCGADYNLTGQRLAPRSQWGEETGETLADILGPEPVEFSEGLAGYEARNRWARDYDELNGAPEGEYDR